MDVVRSNSLERNTKCDLEQAVVCIFSVPELINTVLIYNQVKITELVHHIHHDYRIVHEHVLIVATKHTEVIWSNSLERITNHD